MQWKIPVSLLNSPMLTKREKIAALAHQGLLARGCHGRLAAMEAVKAADLLIQELNRKPGNSPEEGQP